MGSRGEQLIETVPEESQTLDLLHKDFKSAILNLYKELKESMKTMSHQVQNYQIENIKKRKKCIFPLKYRCQRRKQLQQKTYCVALTMSHVL